MSAEKNPKSRSKCGPTGSAEVFRTPSIFSPRPNMENIIAQKEQIQPAFLIIDSIQTMYSAELDSAPGTVSQVRVCGNELMPYRQRQRSPRTHRGSCDKIRRSGGSENRRTSGGYRTLFYRRTESRSPVLRSLKNRFGTIK